MLPDFLRSANTTFVNLRAALDDVDPLVNASKPAARELRPFLATLRKAAADAVPTVRDLDAIVRRPGADNDLVELTRLQPKLADRAVGSGSPDCGPGPQNPDDLQVAADNNYTQGAFGESVCALQNGDPTLAFFRAYTPELVGWFDDFGHSGSVDAASGIGRVETTFNAFSLSQPGGGPDLTDPLSSSELAAALSTRQHAALPGRQRAAGQRHRPVRPLGPVHGRRRAHQRRARDLRPEPGAARPMRRIALILALIAAPIAVLATSAGADDTHTYEIEMYNAFGLVPGSDVRIAGVNAGEVTDLDVDAAKRAIVTVELSGDLGVLGKDTRCSSEPQSLIAEYFISCDPAGPPIQEDDDADNPDPDIPASHVEQTVQTDLVQNTLREPFRQRLALIINEFGTALAGNPDSLNQAIRLGAPALTQLRKVTQILASQNTIIRDLNANSDQVIGKLADRRQDVVRFIQKARDTAEASTARRADLSQDFNRLDDFLAQLRPTLASLDNLAVKQTPLLRDLRAAAPQLTRLSVNLPPFNSATEASLKSLGGASQVGEKALRRGGDEIHQLAQSGAKAPETAEILADFLRDIDDPRRAVEIDDRVTADTGRTNPNPGTKNEKGYTGLEGLLNYAYYQAGAINQFDQIGHLLHFSLYNVFTGPCGNFVSGHDPQTGKPGVPAEGGGTTTNILKADNCVSWLGPNQPGVNEDLGLPKYDPSVCPKGTQPQAAADALCGPGGGASSARADGRALDARRARPGRAAPRSPPPSSQAAAPVRRRRAAAARAAPAGRSRTTSSTRSSTCRRGRSTTCPGTSRTSSAALGGLGQQPQSGGGGSGAGGSGSTGSGGGGSATDDLLDFLFSS